MWRTENKMQIPKHKNDGRNTFTIHSIQTHTQITLSTISNNRIQLMDNRLEIPRGISKKSGILNTTNGLAIYETKQFFSQSNQMRYCFGLNKFIET